jgi:hypothetical protein
MHGFHDRRGSRSRTGLVVVAWVALAACAEARQNLRGEYVSP